MSKHKLLLADDSITIQKVVNLTFADEGIEVVAVSDGDAALLKISEAAPDLIMADVNMPGKNGYQICESIKQNDDLKSIPVILLVGSFEPFDEDEARRVGADDFMTKPFQSIRQLVGKVTELLRREEDSTTQAEESDSDEALEIAEPIISREQHREVIPAYSQTNYDDEMIQTDHGFHNTTAETAKLYPIEHLKTTDFEFYPTTAFPEINTVSDFEAERDEFSGNRNELFNDRAEENFQDDAEPIKNWQAETDTSIDATEPAKIYDFAENDEQEVEETSNEFDTGQKTSDYSEENVADVSEDLPSQPESEEVAVPHSILEINFDEYDLLELPPLEMPVAAATKPNVRDKSEQVNQFAETMNSEISAETNKNEDAGNISPEAIEAIAQRVFEKLSEKFFDHKS